MRAAGVEAVVNAESLSVVGLVEVVRHLPRIWGEYRKLLRAVDRTPPEVAVLTDSPDFHLRLARKLHQRGVRVVLLVAPQAWAWRQGRVPLMRRILDRLLCIFPFEEDFFASRGVNATYIGHPLARLLRPTASREQLRSGYGAGAGEPLIALLPGSRHGEIERHLPVLAGAVELVRRELPEARFILSLPADAKFRERFRGASIQLFRTGSEVQVCEGQTWDVLAAADAALAASGTVTIEACLLGTPLVAFYRVHPLSWFLGRRLVRVPFLSMVNLIAGRQVAPELIQGECTPAALARETLALLRDPERRDTMRRDLAEVSERLATGDDPMRVAARHVCALMEKDLVHAS